MVARSIYLQAPEFRFPFVDREEVESGREGAAWPLFFISKTIDTFHFYLFIKSQREQDLLW